MKYKAIFKVNGTKYESTGETLLDALNTLKIERPRTSGILAVSNGKKTAERKFNRIFDIKRFFFNPTFRIIAAKNLEVRMK